VGVGAKGYERPMSKDKLGHIMGYSELNTGGNSHQKSVLNTTSCIAT